MFRRLPGATEATNGHRTGLINADFYGVEPGLAPRHEAGSAHQQCSENRGGFRGTV